MFDVSLLYYNCTINVYKENKNDNSTTILYSKYNNYIRFNLTHKKICYLTTLRIKKWLNVHYHLKLLECWYNYINAYLITFLNESTAFVVSKKKNVI